MKSYSKLGYNISSSILTVTNTCLNFSDDLKGGSLITLCSDIFGDNTVANVLVLTLLV